MKHSRKTLEPQLVNELIVHLRAVTGIATSSAHFIGDVRVTLLSNTTVLDIRLQLDFSHFDPPIIILISPWLDSEGNLFIGGRAQSSHVEHDEGALFFVDREMLKQRGSTRARGHSLIRAITSSLVIGDWIL